MRFLLLAVAFCGAFAVVGHAAPVAAPDDLVVAEWVVTGVRVERMLPRIQKVFDDMRGAMESNDVPAKIKAIDRGLRDLRGTTDSCRTVVLALHDSLQTEPSRTACEKLALTLSRVTVASESSLVIMGQIHGDPDQFLARGDEIRQPFVLLNGMDVRQLGLRVPVIQAAERIRVARK